MDTESQKRFDEITAQEPAALSLPDIEFLRSRSAYLTGDQAETYASVLASAPAAAVDTGDGSPEGPKALEDMSKAELTAIAEPLGISVGVFDSKASLVEQIRAAQAAQPPQQ